MTKKHKSHPTQQTQDLSSQRCIYHTTERNYCAMRNFCCWSKFENDQNDTHLQASEREPCYQVHLLSKVKTLLICVLFLYVFFVIFLTLCALYILFFFINLISCQQKCSTQGTFSCLISVELKSSSIFLQIE